MQGKTVKTGALGTRGTCSGGSTLVCSEADLLGDDTCKGGGTLVVCAGDDNLNPKSENSSRNTLTCCSGGTLSTAASLDTCGTGQSLCNQAGETLKMK